MIYMDNSATSPVKEEVFNAMVPYLKEELLQDMVPRMV